MVETDMTINDQLAAIRNLQKALYDQAVALARALRPLVKAVKTWMILNENGYNQSSRNGRRPSAEHRLGASGHRCPQGIFVPSLSQVLHRRTRYAYT